MQHLRNAPRRLSDKRLLAAQLHQQGKLNLDEAFMDATFASAKKEASLSADIAD
jgi:hypothetical protein